MLTWACHLSFYHLSQSKMEFTLFGEEQIKEIIDLKLKSLSEKSLMEQLAYFNYPTTGDRIEREELLRPVSIDSTFKSQINGRFSQCICHSQVFNKSLEQALKFDRLIRKQTSAQNTEVNKLKNRIEHLEDILEDNNIDVPPPGEFYVSRKCERELMEMEEGSRA